ncbi:hypothetical protein BJG93_25865 [Paraburkholderia sprentiae WSM5005]|uniref:Uncharacterized protein n=1 Tax=Paraburkholderia sprentiae WSM5005 TaxID=754502 RepID=A0A1I9YSY3_9BURK|nr:hypothetical protein [Paraburkholderia sprentiae]APA89323.1 hypothetical protein BJG93_25865 [Paraburkholderia sprentiae WSM5005]
MTKRILAGIVVGLISVSSHAQLSQLFQSAKEQVTQAATTQLSQGVRSATDDAVQTTSTHAHKAIESVHSPSSASTTSATAQAGDATLGETRR